MNQTQGWILLGLLGVIVLLLVAVLVAISDVETVLRLMDVACP